MKIKVIMTIILIAGALFAGSRLFYNYPVFFNNRISYSFNCEWLPDKQTLGPLAPSSFFNYDSSIMTLGGNGSEKNEVVIGNFSLPEEIKDIDFDLSMEEDRYLAALSAMREGRLAEAELMLLEYLQVLPRHSDAWRQLGDCQYNLGKVHDALWAYENSLKYQPDNFLALRGQAVVTLYMGYESFDLKQHEKSHSLFQKSLNSFHKCLGIRKKDTLSAYGQSLAAEGVSRELYRIARTALNTENHDQAKSIIRNCLDIIDSAISATKDRLERKVNDDEAKMLLSSLLVRRAKVLQPFGHVEEASGNLDQAMAIIEPIAKGYSHHKEAAENQIALCHSLKDYWSK